MPNTIDKFAYDTMYMFLTKYCPIVRKKINQNDRQFTRVITINGAYLRDKTDRVYSLNKRNHQDELMQSLNKALNNVFCFPHKETVMVVSTYLSIDS